LIFEGEVLYSTKSLLSRLHSKIKIVLELIYSALSSKLEEVAVPVFALVVISILLWLLLGSLFRIHIDKVSFCEVLNHGFLSLRIESRLETTADFTLELLLRNNSEELDLLISEDLSNNLILSWVKE
jgi:hypothetical protein